MFRSLKAIVGAMSRALTARSAPPPPALRVTASG